MPVPEAHALHEDAAECLLKRVPGGAWQASITWGTDVLGNATATAVVAKLKTTSKFQPEVAAALGYICNESGAGAPRSSDGWVEAAATSLLASPRTTTWSPTALRGGWEDDDDDPAIDKAEPAER